MPQILRYLWSRNETKAKGNTIKKATLVTHTSDSQATHDGTRSTTGDEPGAFPMKYYRPRPTPKSFVVYKVRKVSKSDCTAQSLKDQAPALDCEKITACKRGSSARLKSTQSSRPNSSQAPSAVYPSVHVAATTTPVKASATEGRPVPDCTQGESCTYSSYRLLLGRQDSRSPYFTRRYCQLANLDTSHKAKDASNDMLHHVPELDPQAFVLYKVYLQTGKISSQYPNNVGKEHMWMASWPLMNAHILGCVVGEPDFADRIIDILSERLTLDMCPDIDTIVHVFATESEGASAALKQIIVNRFIDASEEDRNCLHTTELPESFSRAALKTTLQRLTLGTSLHELSGCKYHIHGTNEACYRTRITLADTLKERRMESARGFSARDAEVVKANVISNDIDAVDWEQRRLDAIRALREKMGRSWVGLRRLQDGRKPSNIAGVTMQSLTGIASEEERIALVPTRARHGMIPLTNGSTQSLDLNGSMNIASVLCSKKIDTGASTASPLPTFHCSPPPATYGLTKVVSDPNLPKHDSHSFAPAELPGSTIYDLPQSTRISQECRPGMSWSPNNGDRASKILVVVNNTQKIDMVKPGSKSNFLLSKASAERDINEFVEGVKVPGAYPEPSVDCELHYY